MQNFQADFNQKVATDGNYENIEYMLVQSTDKNGDIKKWYQNKASMAEAREEYPGLEVIAGKTHTLSYN
jgi:hypothetical protein